MILDESTRKTAHNDICYSNEYLDNAIDKMLSTGLHKVFIEQEKSNKIFCGFITYELIFEFFFNNFYEGMDSIQIVEVKDLDFFKNSLIKLNKDDSIITCFHNFERYKVSFIPVMNGEEIYGYLFLKDFIYLWHFNKEIDVKYNLTSVKRSHIKFIQFNI